MFIIELRYVSTLREKKVRNVAVLGGLWELHDTPDVVQEERCYVSLLRMCCRVYVGWAVELNLTEDHMNIALTEYESAVTQ